MKKIMTLAALFVLTLSSVNSYAELATSAPEPFAGLQTPASFDKDIFQLIVTSNGKFMATSGKLFSVGDETGVTLATLETLQPSLTYPEWALQQKWQGEMVLAIEILEDGSVGRTFVMKSTGNTELDQQVTNTLSQWKFNPAQKEGKPLLSCVQIPVKFQVA